MSLKKNSDILEISLSNDGIMRLNLNNPINSNALSEKMINLLQDHLDKVEQVLQKLQKAGLKVNAKKSKFCNSNNY